MLKLRALYVFLWSLVLTPVLALAQATDPVEPYTPYDSTRWGLSWVWMAVLAAILVALVAWGLSRDRFQRGPPLTP